MACLGTLGCGPEGPICSDPAVGEVDEECGVWVSKTLGDDANPGTRTAPMASLSAAGEAAFKKNVDVYACGDTWTEPVIWPANVSMYGGFDCANGWACSSHCSPELIQARLLAGHDGENLTALPEVASWARS